MKHSYFCVDSIGSLVDPSHKGPEMWNFDVFVDASLNNRNKIRVVGDMRRHETYITTL